MTVWLAQVDVINLAKVVNACFGIPQHSLPSCFPQPLSWKSDSDHVLAVIFDLGNSRLMRFSDEGGGRRYLCNVLKISPSRSERCAQCQRVKP